MKYGLLYKILKIKECFSNFCKNTPLIYEIFILNRKKKLKDKERKPIVEASIKRLLNLEKFPYPAAIEIETYNKCNGDCDFCPINKNLDTREHKYMDEKLFYSIIAQLKEINYQGFLSEFSNNEPLLDQRIFEFSKHIKQELPLAVKIFFTNGLLLDLEKFRELINCVDYMVIDHYYEGELKLRENIAKIARYCLENEELKSKVKIQTINKHALRNNRGGNSKNRRFVYKLKSSCLYPFCQCVIRSSGEISLCCNDAKGFYTMGDLNKQKLVDIWNNEKYQKIREDILISRAKVELCKNCDNFGVSDTDRFIANYKVGKNWDKIEDLLRSNN